MIIAPILIKNSEAFVDAIKKGGKVTNSSNRFALRIEPDQIGVPDVIGITWYATENMRANRTHELPICPASQTVCVDPISSPKNPKNIDMMKVNSAKIRNQALVETSSSPLFATVNSTLTNNPATIIATANLDTASINMTFIALSISWPSSPNSDGNSAASIVVSVNKNAESDALASLAIFPLLLREMDMSPAPTRVENTATPRNLVVVAVNASPLS